MPNIKKIVTTLSAHGFGPYICVPCSILKPFINYVIDSDNLEYIKATSEGEAVGIAAGAYLAGKLPVIMMQNSGLGNAVNPITSLTNIYKIPALFIVSHRGEPGKKDEPQHEIMGQITSDMLTLTGIQNTDFPENEDQLEKCIKLAADTIKETSLPFAFILKKGIIENYKLQKVEQHELSEGSFVLEDDNKSTLQTRIDAIQIILENITGDEPIVSTTGMISRELFTLSDKPNHLYMVGSMGCASSLALGISLYKKSKKIIILDGDGALLMKMGTLATIGHYQPENILHIVLDNESYDSTGGQGTVSSTVNIAKIAACCGYKKSATVYSKNNIQQNIKEHISSPGLTLLHIKVKKGHPEQLGRPSITPVDAKKRFKEYLANI